MYKGGSAVEQMSSSSTRSSVGADGGSEVHDLKTRIESVEKSLVEKDQSMFTMVQQIEKLRVDCSKALLDKEKLLQVWVLG